MSELGVSGYSWNDLLNMTLPQIRAIRSGGKRTASVVYRSSAPPSLEEIQRMNAEWNDFLVKEYGAIP